MGMGGIFHHYFQFPHMDCGISNSDPFGNIAEGGRAE
jgi:hypothetical protein